MSYRHISQPMARQLQRRVEELEQQERTRADGWTSDWPRGVNIGNAQFTANSALIGAIRTSRKLGHAVVVSCNENGLVNFHAILLSAKG
jgi:hypothetical protein